MKSIKRGRGPSMRSGITGLAVGLFGVFWTIGALSMGAPWIFAGFGVVFVAIAVSNALYDIKNATSKRRYSEYDITTDGAEPDPLNERFGGSQSAGVYSDEREDFAFCPYCGRKLDEGDQYCRQCGRKLGQAQTDRDDAE